MIMSKRTREKKSAKPQQPAKPDEISVGRRFAQPCAKARLLFDHALSYREWNIVGQYDVPGFFYLESRFRLNSGEQPAIYTAFELCLHECQFERVQVRSSSFPQPVFVSGLHLGWPYEKSDSGRARQGVERLRTQARIALTSDIRHG
jgi:hypothetical protein